MSKYTVNEAISALAKKSDIRIRSGFHKVSGEWHPIRQLILLKNKVLDSSEGWIPNPQRSNDLGNGSQGKIDFLVSQGFKVRYVNRFYD